MSCLHLVRIGDVEPALLEALRAPLARHFRRPCQVADAQLEPAFALHPEREQYHSTELITRLESFRRPDTWRLVGVAAVDLYIPILTFVFGEAQMQGSCAVISSFRLRQEFYGLPADAALTHERLLKEAVHEVGHTLRLTHCASYECAMSASHSVELIDLKSAQFCAGCRTRAGLLAA